MRNFSTAKTPAPARVSGRYCLEIRMDTRDCLVFAMEFALPITSCQRTGNVNPAALVG